ncbi:2-aminoethylphosphonate ABC transporter permease subunit [Rhodococcus sp. ABRD24]|uniref:2-aminoethylphosphonate ABC transporter permease subunit n=1 Tax=Rhodococcus sp. ABRD24 TaxID=2507582 RepID=UPI00103D1B9C|nr:2-aminoethylphosphonate ABC transporter permease subunit [Rhodococcus sp. ABRD24]QBJ98057.1 2-aminoethylphosphonate ABC transporter permease subunit [Rhodococcus sp. ABRD24]
MTTVLDSPIIATPPERPELSRWRSGLWVLPPLLLVLGFAVYPMARVLAESTVTPTGRGWSTWTEVLGSSSFRKALWRTVEVAVASTLGCLVLGTFLALVLAFVPFPGSKVVGRLIDTILSLPSFLITLAFTFLYGTAGAVNALITRISGAEQGPLNFLNTPFGVIAAEITFFTPFVVRPLLAAFTQMPREQLDVAASLGASPLRVLRTVVLPEAWPAMMAGGSLVLLLTLNEFGIVLFTGAKDVMTLPVLIYTHGIVTFDLPGAAVIATVQVALSLALYGGYRFVFTRLMGGSRAAVDPTR